MRLFRAFLVSAFALALVLVPATSAFAAKPTRAFVDDFDSLDPGVWETVFFGFPGNPPSSGTAAVDAGVLSLRPSVGRGAVVLTTREPAVTSLPARVTWRVRYPGAAFRGSDVLLVSEPDTPDGGGALPPTYVQLRLGSVASPYAGSYLQVLRGGEVIALSPFEATVLPSDTFLDGEMRLYAHSVKWSFNGITRSAKVDMVSVLADAGHLHLMLDAFDDYECAGFEVDRVSVEARKGTGTAAGVKRNGTVSFERHTPSTRGR